jgi:hypothetical protein
MNRQQIHPDIITFYQSFEIFYNASVKPDSVTYSKQHYQTDATLQQAKKLIKDKGLSLTAVYSPVFNQLSVQVI